MPTTHDPEDAIQGGFHSSLATENAALRSEVEAANRRLAKAAVDAAKADLRIPPQDHATAKAWEDLLVADPTKKALLDKVPARMPVLARKFTGGSRSPVTITREDTNTVLRAFIEAGSPLAMGLRYRLDVKPRLDAGENVLARWPVEASNQLGTLANAVVSQRVLELVVSKRPMLRGVVNDFSDELASLGDTVKTRTVDIPSMTNFGASPSNANDTEIEVTLDSFKQVAYTFTAAEIVSTTRNLVAERSEALALGIGNGIADAVAALITEGNFGTSNQTIQATAGVSFDTIVAINQAMNTAGVPDMGRFGWVNAAVAAALSNDQLVTEYIDKTPIARAYATWRNIKGFENIWEFPALPANSINLTGFFASRSAIVVAARVPHSPTDVLGPGAYPGTLRVVTDPVTGFSVLQNEYADGNSWATTSRLVTLFGVRVGNPAVGHTLVSAA